MCYINKHHVEAWFDEETKLFHHIIYVDENSLYDSGMSSKLLKNGFRRMSNEEIKMLTNEWFVNNFDPEGDTGYILRCDLEYPSECQNATMDLPLAPESGTIHGMSYPHIRSNNGSDREVKNPLSHAKNCC